MNSPAKKIACGIIALVAWFALLLQLYLMLSNNVTGFSKFRLIGNFFSYFTILSNILVAICCTSELASKPDSFFSRVTVQTAIAVYIFIVGLVYNLVLRGLWQPEGWQLVADNLLHVMVPVIFLIYWIIFTPKRILEWSDLLPWLIFPAAYLVYSLIRGLVVNWYPYPFVNPDQLGYLKVAVNSVFVALAVVVTGLAFIGYNRLGKGRQR